MMGVSVNTSCKYLLTSINVDLAQGKDRKDLNWFLISLLFSPITTFLLLVMEDLKSI